MPSKESYVRKSNAKPLKIEKMGLISCNESYEAEALEMKIRKALDGTENLELGKPALFTRRGDGVLPETDIRTDRWDIAMEAQNHVNQIKSTEYDRITNLRENEEEAKQEVEAQPTE